MTAGRRKPARGRKKPAPPPRRQQPGHGGRKTPRGGVAGLPAAPTAQQAPPRTRAARTRLMSLRQKCTKAPQTRPRQAPATNPSNPWEATAEGGMPTIQSHRKARHVAPKRGRVFSAEGGGLFFFSFFFSFFRLFFLTLRA